MERYLGLPEAASAHAADIDFMMGLVHWLMVVLFVGWIIYFFYVLFRFRSSRSPRASYTGTQTKASNYVEGGVVLAEAVLLLAFSFPLWADRVSRFPEGDDVLRIRVVAEQFVWNVHYSGPDGVFGRTSIDRIDPQTNPLGIDWSDPHAADDITTINQVVIPVDRPVIIDLSSKDVIHSFGVPEFRVKQDTIPGLTIPLWFTPTVTTTEMRQIKGNDKFEYEIACAQLCGIGHYRMRGFVTVLSQAEFDAWKQEQVERRLEEDDRDDFWN